MPPPQFVAPTSAHRLLAAALLLLSATPAPAAPPRVSLGARLDRPPPVASSRAGVILDVSVEVGGVELAEPSPLTVVLVLDVSGSMDGAKIEALRRSCHMVVDRLGPADRLSILTFESSAHDLYSPPGAPVLDRAREVIAGLRARGGTNMIDGLRLGMRKLGELAGPEAVARILLLGDGHANLGEGDMQRVAAWSRDHEAAVSTFGVGRGFQAEAMERLARVSGGNFHATPDEADLEAVFAAELDEMRRNAGDQAQLVIKPSWGLEPGEVLGAEADLEAGPGVISLRNLVAGSSHRLRVRLVPGASSPTPGTQGRVDLSLSYLDEVSGDSRQAFTHTTFTWAAAPPAGEESTP